MELRSYTGDIACLLRGTDCIFKHNPAHFSSLNLQSVAGPSGRAVYGVGLQPLACCDRGFESHLGLGCLSVVSVVCCQVEVSATD